MTATEIEPKIGNLDFYKSDVRRACTMLAHLAVRLLSNGPFFSDESLYEIAIDIEHFATSLRKAAEAKLEGERKSHEDS